MTSKICALLLTAAALQPATAQDRPSWGDQGNGTYINPVLNADYSDPDVIRVGEKYYMTASDFHYKRSRGRFLRSFFICYNFCITPKETPASLALTIAEDAYAQTLQRFIKGQADAYSLSVAQSHWQTARQNQIASLQNYWLAYIVGGTGDWGIIK